MLYRPDDILAFGKNKGYSLKTIYQYEPSYLKWLIKFIQEFEIDLDEFRNLPKSTIPDPTKTFDKFGIGWDDPIKFNASD